MLKILDLTSSTIKHNNSIGDRSITPQHRASTKKSFKKIPKRNSIVLDHNNVTEGDISIISKQNIEISVSGLKAMLNNKSKPMNI